METEIIVETSVRVRYAETDQMGIVYYANYLIYFEIGRTEFIRKIWKPYSEIESYGYILPALSAAVQYKGSARYDDLLKIKTVLKKYSRVKLEFNYEITREDGRSIATGTTVHCFTDLNGKPRRMMGELWELLRRLEE